ncbi:cohesin loading factor subunit SCC2, partial [Paragonimus westermani]
MNGDISRIPIQSLGAVVSLTDILPELPLPAPLQTGSSTDSLLWEPELPDNVHHFLQSRNEHLTNALTGALETVYTDNIDFKDGFASDSVDLNVLPNLLDNVLVHNHAIFQHRRGFFGLPSFGTKSAFPIVVNDVSEQLTVNTDSWNAPLDSRTSITSTTDDPNSSCSGRKKKKHKKKKHKHRETDDGDTSGTGGESNATTPATYDGTPSRKFEDNALSPTPTYGVVADRNKLSLKIFKRPAGETTTTNESAISSEPTKKEKKKKRSKEKDREHKSRRERGTIPNQFQLGLVGSTNVTVSTDSGATVPVCTTECVVSLPSTQSIHDVTEALVAITSAAAVIPGYYDPSQTTHATAELSFISNDSLFEQIGSSNLSYRQPQSQSTSSLPSTPASSAGIGRLVSTSSLLPISTTISDSSCPTDLSNHVFVPQATLFDGILNDVDASISFMGPSGITTSDLLNATPNCGSSSSAVCNIMDYASHYLQNEMLSSTSMCDGFPAAITHGDDATLTRSSEGLSPASHSFTSSFMIASQLADSNHANTTAQAMSESDFNLSSSILNPNSYIPIPGTSPSAAFTVHNFDIAGLASEPAGTHLHHVPMGLASYLAASGKPTPQTSQSQARRSNARTESSISGCSNTSTPQSLWKRKAPGPLRRRKRRKNELEDLQQWTVNYPTGGVGSAKAAAAAAAAAERTADERTWDETIGNYSQVLGERAKRRKRMARQTGNFDPAYVFEHDKDYHNGGESDAGTEAEPDTLNPADDSDHGQGNLQSLASRGLRSGTAQRSYVGMDDDDNDTAGLGSNSGTESNSTARRRRKVDDDEPFEVRLKEPVEARFPHLMRKSSDTVRKRRERVGFGTATSEHISTHCQHIASTSVLGAEAGSLKRFLQRLQNVLDQIEDSDLLQTIDAANPHREDVQTDRGAILEPISRTSLPNDCVPSEAFIAPEELAELCREAAKLNTTRMANQIPTDQLVKLITLLLINIRDGSSVIATLRPDEAADEHENRLWRELAMERVMRSVNAGLTGLLLMTSNDMPREVYVEDVIERTVQTVRFQLFNCIYPEFDPAYRVENTAKENQSSIKSRRARERELHKPRAIIHLYHKLVEIVSNLAKLVKIQRLTDSLVLALSSVGVSVFFVENVSELQLAALELVTAIFAQYEPHRKLIMEEILASLARLPSSKRNLRSYRLNTEDSIQMLTALSLLLVQSVIVLPAPSDTKATGASEISRFSNNAATLAEDSGLNTTTSVAQKTDDEVLVINSYHNALRTAHTFLLVFLRKSTIKGEDDYRFIFENFVNDLLLAVNKPEWPAAEVMLSLLGSLLVQQFNNKSLDQSVRVASVDYLGTVASTLRRDAVNSQLKENDIDAVIRDLLEEESHSEDEEEEEEEQDSEKKSTITVNVFEQNGDLVKKDIKSDNESNATADNVNENGKDQLIPTKQIKPEHNKLSAKNGFASPSLSYTSDPPDIVTNELSFEFKKKNRKKSSKPEQAVDPIAQLDRVQALRDAILDYLAVEDASPTAVYARKFYLAQWLNDCTKETERAQRTILERKGENLVNGGPDVNRSAKKLAVVDQELVFAIAERRRHHILLKIREPPDTWRQRRHFWNTAVVQPPTERKGNKIVETPTAPLIFHGTLDYEDTCLVCRYLASLRPFSQSFDVYLSQICKLLSESSVPVRTKALRCLSAVVEADPNVLARVDIERAVHARLLDTSTSVREAAVDLLGRFLGRKPELTAQYYPMLAERIRDKGVSVRKRVIRILRDICLEQPDFPRIAEICVKMIRRVNDEEGIKKLVHEVFQTMWFSPVRDKETVKLLRKVMNITDVVAACKDTGYEWFEQFLRTLLKKEEAEKVKPVEKACKQIVDCLVQYIMRLEEISGQNNQRLVACLATLHLLTKIRPELMVQYAMVLQTYLRCNETSDAHILHYVARILEVTVPLMEHPSETFVAQLEEDMVRLTLRHGKMVLESCVACLGSVVNRVSKNYSLARDCFTRLFNALQRFRSDLADDPKQKISPTIRPSILRALFTVGLLCKHFDANVFQSHANTNVRDQVFDILMFFTEQVKSDLEMRKKALSGLGFLCTRHHELLCGQKLRDFYQHLLQVEPSKSSMTSCEDHSKNVPDHQLELKCIVLENLLNFFLEEEKRMLDADAKWKARQHQESLKEMGDVASGMGSFVAQTYLKDTLETFFSAFGTVRLTALSVVSTILRQGLIHPVQTVPYLIAMQTDLDANVRVKADVQLQEINHKFPGFLSMRAIQGVSFSYRLQFILYPEVLQMVSQKSKIYHSTGLQQMLSPESTAGKKSDPAQPTRRSARNRGSGASVALCDASETSDRSSLVEEGNSKGGKGLDDSSERLPPISDYAEGSFECIRGTRDPLTDIPNALNSNLYSMLRGNRGQRRSLLSGLIALFDDSQPNSQRVHLSQLIYIADNLAHFPYQCQEEPLFVIHHIDLMVSMSGSGVLQSVRETLFPELKVALEAALAAQAEIEMNNRTQFELQLRSELQALQVASAEATANSDHALAEQHADQIQVILQKLNLLVASNPPNLGGGSSMNELRSVALVGRDLTFIFKFRLSICSAVPHIDLGPLEEEEEDSEALLKRLSSSRATALPIMRDAIRCSRACVLLLTLKQYLKEVYSITDAKIQRYSPTDSPKLWERPLTRRAGMRFHPGPCLQAAGVELRKLIQSLNRQVEHREQLPEWPPVLDSEEDLRGEESFDGEMQSLVHDYLDFRKLILTIDPPGDEELADELNTSVVSNSGQLAQAVCETTHNQAHLPTVRLRPTKTLVPQSHSKSSDEENDSEDSNAGGSSRLMLAQSAPNRRRKPVGSLRPSASVSGRVGTCSRPIKRKRKRRKRYT